jgi:hypothetical protein
MTIETTPVRIPANRSVTRRLGHWTEERDFEVRSHRGAAMLDLRSPRIPDGDIRITVDLDHASLTLLVAPDAVIDDWDVHRSGRASVKDAVGPVGAGRAIMLSGRVHNGEIVVRRGGVAQITAMLTREYVDDLRHARRTRGFPTVDDPTRTV